MTPIIRARNHSDVTNAIGNLQAFDHSSMSARWAIVAGEEAYLVYSYATVILAVLPAAKQLWISQGRYSVTTSKHMSMTWKFDASGYSVHGFAHRSPLGLSALANLDMHVQRHGALERRLRTSSGVSR